MSNYNTELISLSEKYNAARAEAEKQITKLKANIGNMYSQDYIRTECEKLERKITEEYTKKGEDLLNRISNAKNKALREVQFSKYPSLKTNPGSFEIAYSNAKNFLASVKDDAHIEKEAEEALLMGRTDFAFILFDELEKQKGTKSLDPNFRSILEKARIAKALYFDENGIKYSEVVKNSEELIGNEWDAQNILDDFKSGFPTTFPFRLFDKVSDNMKVDMSISLERMSNLTKKILYNRATKTGQLQIA